MAAIGARQSGLQLRFGHAANLASPIGKFQAQLMLRYCVWEVITLVPLALEPCPSQLTGRRAGQQLLLSKRAKNPVRCQSLVALAEMWTRLAAELESDQPLLSALSEIDYDEPFYAMPTALNLRAA